MRKQLLFLLAGPLAIQLCAGCSGQAAPALIPPVNAAEDTAVVTRRDVVVSDQYPAAVVYYEEAVSFGQASLLIGDIPVSPGDSVKKGDVLARLDTSEIENQLRDAQKSLAQTAAGYDLSNADTQTDIDIAQLDIDALVSGEASQTDVRLARIALDRQKLVLEQTKESQAMALAIRQKQIDVLQAQIGQAVITAPFDGIVVDIDITRGSPALPFAPAAVIADPTRPYVEYRGSDNFIYSDKYKITAQIGSQTYPLVYAPLSMEERIRYAMALTALPARFSFEGGFGADVTAGGFANITVVKQEEDDVPTVPVNAIYASNDGTYVYVCRDDGSGGTIKTPAPVKTGLTNECYAEITDGVSEGDVVYVRQQ